MDLAPKPVLTPAEIERGLQAVIQDGLAYQVMLVLTEGVFLVAFALQLGASNFYIGLLAAIAPLANLFQLPAVPLVERIRNRRLICVVSAGLSRLTWLLIALLPFMPDARIGLGLLLGAKLLNGIFGAIAGSSWLSWMHDLVPKDRLGAFFSRRMTLASAVGMAVSLALGFYLDFWKHRFPAWELYGYSIIFLLAVAAGLTGVAFQLRTPEPRMEPPAGPVPPWWHSLLKPLQDANFRRLIFFSGSWSFAANLAAPFLMVYMLRELQFSVPVIIGFTVLSQLTNLFFLRIWGRFSDRYSHKAVLAITAPLFILCYFGWTFATLPEKHLFTLPLVGFLQIMMGTASAGVTLASGTIGLKLAPRGQGMAYLVVQGLVNALAAGAAPLLGGRLADFFAGHRLAWSPPWSGAEGLLGIPALWLRHGDFLFLLTFLLGLYSLRRLALVQEPGRAVGPMVFREVIDEVISGMRNLSPIGGLYRMVNLPLSLIRPLRPKPRPPEEG